MTVSRLLSYDCDVRFSNGNIGIGKARVANQFKEIIAFIDVVPDKYDTLLPYKSI